MLRMTQTSTALSIFALFLHTTFGESGCTSADGDADPDAPQLRGQKEVLLIVTLRHNALYLGFKAINKLSPAFYLLSNYDRFRSSDVLPCWTRSTVCASRCALAGLARTSPAGLRICSQTGDAECIYVRGKWQGFTGMRGKQTRKVQVAFNFILKQAFFASYKTGTFGDDEPDNFDIDCFSHLEFKGSYSSLTCNFTELPPHNTNYTLSLCTKEDSDYVCFNMEKQEDVYFLEFTDILSNKDLCMDTEMKRRICKSLVVTDIVKPEVPFNINITYQKEANEYLIHYSTPHSWKKYLRDKLIHQIAYRQEEGTWKTIETPYLQIKLLGKNLENDASYEVKVRSQPNGDYFKGTWSEWSTSQSFRTAREQHSTESYSSMVVLILSILGFILSIVMVVLIITFWENRIKPAVWPNLPDHKKTLEQLCKKPKNNFDISFNPESFGYVHIHKVDGIRAKAELENFLQPSTSPETNLPEKFKSRSDLKMIPAMTDKSNLNLSVTYGGIWPAEALHKLLGTNQLAVTEGNCSSSTYKVCHSNGVPLCNDGFNLSSTPPPDLSDQPRPEPLNGDTVSQTLPTSEMRSPNNEEAYVTMSSFYKIQ